MRRIVLLATLVVVLGLCTAVGSAWLAAALPALPMGAETVTPAAAIEGAYTVARGWPKPCLAYTWQGAKEGEHAFPIADETSISGWPIRPFGAGEQLGHALPVKPVWLQLIVSTALWAVFWLLLLGVLLVRRDLRQVRRRLRGECPWCGHDRRQDSEEECPECGWENGRRMHPVTNWHLGVAGCALAVVVAADVVVAKTLVGRFVPPGEMHVASCLGDLEQVRALLAGGADVDARSWGETPLSCAAAHGHTTVVAALLEAGADPNGTNAEGVRVAYRAAVNKDIATLELLLERGAGVDGDEAREALLTAACAGELELVRTLLAAGADAGSLALGDVLEASRDWEPARRVEMLSALIDAGAVVTAAVAETALAGDDEAFTARVIERGIEAGALSPGLLVQEILDDRTACRAVGVMADLGIDVHEPAPVPSAEHARAPLLLAKDACRLRVVRCLLAVPGAERWRQETWRETMRTLETVSPDVFSKWKEIADLLVDAGADPSATDEQGRTLLFSVDWENASYRYLNYVFELGIDVNHRDDDGRTALDEAVAADSVIGADELVEHGAEPTDESVLEWVDRRILMHPGIDIRMKLKRIQRTLVQASRARETVGEAPAGGEAGR